MYRSRFLSENKPIQELITISPTEVALIGLTSFSVRGPLWAWLSAGEVPTVYALGGGAIVLVALSAQALSSSATSRVAAR